MDFNQCFLSVYEKCRNELSDFEIWDGYYKLRYEEFRQLYTVFPKKEFEQTLEIGCGIGYQASFLSCISKKVIASDVDFGNMKKHSRGLGITRTFIKRAGIENIDIVNANAEELPFGNEEFDLIYCSYSFQYISDKEKAFSEIMRVLRKDGFFICLLPTSYGRIKAGGNYYFAGLKKYFSYTKISNKLGKIVSASEKSNQRESWFVKLFPKPDDDKNNYFSELIIYSSWRWKRLFKLNKFKIVKKMHLKSDQGHTKNRFFGTKKLSEGLVLIVKK